MKLYNYIKLKTKPFWDLLETYDEILSRGIDCVSVTTFWSLEGVENSFSATDVEIIKQDLMNYYMDELCVNPDLNDLDFVLYMAVHGDNAYPLLVVLQDETESMIETLLQIHFEQAEMNKSSIEEQIHKL